MIYTKRNLTLHMLKPDERSKSFIVRTVERTVRMKFLDWLLGSEQKITIIVPGESIKGVTIDEVEREASDEPHEAAG